MTKADIVRQVYQTLGYSKRGFLDVIEHFFDIVKNCLVNGETVKVSGLGNFTVRKKRARKGRNPQTGGKIEIGPHPVAGEDLDLPTASVDFVFSCLVLCTVEKPEQVIAEVRRVLRPGGRFACIEHVAAPAGSTVLGFQRLIRRQWKWLFEGCDLCRDIASLLRSSRFAQVEIQEFVGKTIMVPLRHQIVAECVN